MKCVAYEVDNLSSYAGKRFVVVRIGIHGGRNQVVAYDDEARAYQLAEDLNDNREKEV